MLRASLSDSLSPSWAEMGHTIMLSARTLHMDISSRDIPTKRSMAFSISPCFCCESSYCPWGRLAQCSTLRARLASSSLDIMPDIKAAMPLLQVAARDHFSLGVASAEMLTTIAFALPSPHFPRTSTIALGPLSLKTASSVDTCRNWPSSCQLLAKNWCKSADRVTLHASYCCYLPSRYAREVPTERKTNGLPVCSPPILRLQPPTLGRTPPSVTTPIPSCSAPDAGCLPRPGRGLYHRESRWMLWPRAKNRGQDGFHRVCRRRKNLPRSSSPGLCVAEGTSDCLLCTI